MGVDSPLKLVGGIVFCSARFEGLVSALYEQMAKRIKGRAASVSLSWLSARSRSNSAFLAGVASALGADGLDEDCRSVVGLPWRLVEEVMSAVVGREFLEGDLPAQLLEKLDSWEGFIGVEAYLRVLFSTLGNVLSSLAADGVAGVLSTIMLEMSREEEFHEELLRKCRSALSP